MQVNTGGVRPRSGSIDSMPRTRTARPLKPLPRRHSLPSRFVEPPPALTRPTAKQELSSPERSPSIERCGPRPVHYSFDDPGSFWDVATVHLRVDEGIVIERKGSCLGKDDERFVVHPANLAQLAAEIAQEQQRACDPASLALRLSLFKADAGRLIDWIKELDLQPPPLPPASGRSRVVRPLPSGDVTGHPPHRMAATGKA
ncbi:MAG TPA: hypothetical protein VHA82_06455 [Ramlibacter sp.]|uniref:hypothetical protein n=1 Tax=Ramlibacter sp. TaxID=1917967 RepID=UPI002C4E9A4F|nr:hypothetical protein [Ramlibacter sp.]HVZ43436.1 hypothetical protein [Ramlibacter sp.]